MNTGLRNFFRGLFETSTNEVRGYFVLFLIVLFSLAVPLVVKMTIDTRSVQDEGDLKILDSLVALIDRNPVEIKGVFLIDPNKASFDSLKAAGLDQGIARRIIHYRQRGGHFKYREELKKIYGMDEKTYKNFKCRLDLPDSLTYVKRDLSRHLDINRSKIPEVMLLAGLDGKLAGRVIRYRERLGGYVSRDQFNELYGLSDEQLQKLKDHFYVSKKFVPVKINVNKAGWQDLSRHPYISQELARSIVRYREINGSIVDMNELSSFSMVDEQRRKKLFPYLEF